MKVSAWRTYATAANRTAESSSFFTAADRPTRPLSLVKHVLQSIRIYWKGNLVWDKIQGPRKR
jgi:hypothetical protein